MKGNTLLLASFLVLTVHGFASPEAFSGENDPSLRPTNQPECGSIEQCFDEARITYQAGEGQKTVALTEALLRQEVKPPWKGRARLLMARALDQAGDPKAAELYQAALADLPELGDYILFSLGRFYLKIGQPKKAVESLERLSKRYPENLLKSEALYLAAEAHIQASDSASAAENLEAFIRLYPGDPKVPSALYLMGMEHLKQGNRPKAIEVFRTVAWQYPNDPASASARAEMEDLAALGAEIPVLTAEEKYQMARALYQGTRYHEAAAAFEEILASSPNPKIRSESSLYLGISLVRLRKWSQAISIFEKLLEERPEGQIAGEALSWFGRAALRLDDLEKLRQAHEIHRKAYPERPEKAMLLWFLAFYYESKKEDQKAIEISRELIKSFPQNGLAQQAYWQIGWIHYKKGRIHEGIKALDELLERYPQSSFKPQALYWKARFLERSGNLKRAKEVSAHLCEEHTRTYYCHQTRNIGEDHAPKLGLSGRPSWESKPHIQRVHTPLTGEGGQSQEKGSRNAVDSDPRFKKASELILIGFSDEAVRELNALAAHYAGNRQALLALAERLYSARAYSHSLRIIRLYFQEALEKGHSQLSERFWELAYPMGLMDQINRLNGDHGLNPYLVASIIREESGFDPAAVSPAGALGLMQVMPRTGDWVARKLGLSDFMPDQLLDPETNIRLGIWYLGHLYGEFKGNLVYAVAAYNAGPDAVTEWIRRGNYQSMDEFVEQIPFSETRLYVKRVLRSYFEYQSLNRLPAAAFLDKKGTPEYS